MGHMEQVDQYLDVLYGEKGLGLNVLRINVGGSGRPTCPTPAPTAACTAVLLLPWMKRAISM